MNLFSVFLSSLSPLTAYLKLRSKLKKYYLLCFLNISSKFFYLLNFHYLIIFTFIISTFILQYQPILNYNQFFYSFINKIYAENIIVIYSCLE